VTEGDARSRSGDLTRRVLSSALLIPVLIALIWKGGWAFAALLAVVTAIATHETYRILLRRISPVAWAGVGLALLLPFGARFPSKFTGGLPWVLLFFLFAALVAALMTPEAPADAFQPVPPLLFGLLYGALPMATLVPLRELPQGLWWVVAACAPTWMNDTGAYFSGHAFGRHKLHPRVSPSKTWEGFVGGMLASIGTAFVVRALGASQLSPRDCLALGVAVSILGPLGDLAESLLKRSMGVKDSGRLIPGHGGLLDRIDALIFTAPCVYFYASRIKGVLWP
jgi:phosphatidate cytidylyltransferase